MARSGHLHLLKHHSITLFSLVLNTEKIVVFIAMRIFIRDVIVNAAVPQQYTGQIGKLVRKVIEKKLSKKALKNAP